MIVDELNGKKIAILVSNYGVEEAELASPRQAVLDSGGTAVVVAVSDDPIQTLVGDKSPGKQFTPDRVISGEDASGYDGLIVPGGTINADQLRINADAIAFVDAFITAKKPIASICHGPWALVE